jgi:hypothetical protein
LLKKGTESGTGTLAPTNRLTIINNGITDSIIVLRNNKDGVKLTNGSNVITGTYGDTYTIKSNDLSRFAISKWEITDSAGIKTEKVATPTQSLSIDLTINVNVSYSVTLTVTTPDLKTISKIPEIVVENKDEKLKYNVNSRQDFELKIQKNEFVERVTVFISNEVYEYRDLNNKDKTASIRIPFFAFKQIGNFKVYLVPSSILGDGARVETIINAVDDGNYSGPLVFSVAASGNTGANTATERMRITTAGNVGIGTSSPTQALAVNGTVRVNNANTTYNKLLVLVANRHYQ